MEALLSAMAGFLFFGFILAIAIYIIQAIFLNKFHKLVYGKGTAMAWIPIANIYLLGKLSFNKVVGWILILIYILNGNYTITFNGIEKSFSLLPENISSIVYIIHSLIVFSLFIFAIIKYNDLKKNNL